eukprot:6472924-Amphidinium_carterae.1
MGPYAGMRADEIQKVLTDHESTLERLDANLRAEEAEESREEVKKQIKDDFARVGFEKGGAKLASEQVLLLEELKKMLDKQVKEKEKTGPSSAAEATASTGGGDKRQQGMFSAMLVRLLLHPL